MDETTLTVKSSTESSVQSSPPGPNDDDAHHDSLSLTSNATNHVAAHDNVRLMEAHEQVDALEACYSLLQKRQETTHAILSQTRQRQATLEAQQTEIQSRLEQQQTTYKRQKTLRDQVSITLDKSRHKLIESVRQALCTLPHYHSQTTRGSSSSSSFLHDNDYQEALWILLYSSVQSLRSKEAALVLSLSDDRTDHDASSPPLDSSSLLQHQRQMLAFQRQRTMNHTCLDFLTLSRTADSPKDTAATLQQSPHQSSSSSPATNFDPNVPLCPEELNNNNGDNAHGGCTDPFCTFQHLAPPSLAKLPPELALLAPFRLAPIVRVLLLRRDDEEHEHTVPEKGGKTEKEYDTQPAHVPTKSFGEMKEGESNDLSDQEEQIIQPEAIPNKDTTPTASSKAPPNSKNPQQPTSKTPEEDDMDMSSDDEQEKHTVIARQPSHTKNELVAEPPAENGDLPGNGDEDESSTDMAENQAVPIEDLMEYPERWIRISTGEGIVSFEQRRDESPAGELDAEDFLQKWIRCIRLGLHAGRLALPTTWQSCYEMIATNEFVTNSPEMDETLRATIQSLWNLFWSASFSDSSNISNHPHIFLQHWNVQCVLASLCDDSMADLDFGQLATLEDGEGSIQDMISLCFPQNKPPSTSGNGGDWEMKDLVVHGRIILHVLRRVSEMTHDSNNPPSMFQLKQLFDAIGKSMADLLQDNETTVLSRDLLLTPLCAAQMSLGCHLRQYHVVQLRLEWLTHYSANLTSHATNWFLYSSLLWSQILQLQVCLPPFPEEDSDERDLQELHKALAASLSFLGVTVRHFQPLSPMTILTSSHSLSKQKAVSPPREVEESPEQED